MAHASLRRVEWPTLLVFAGCYATWSAATLFHASLGPVLFTLVMALAGALHLSLQHEALHGHPTRSRRANELIASLPLTLIVPYRRYRSLHLAHHHDERLTDPILDPESAYLLPERWRALGRVPRALLAANNTLVGRLLLGPFLWIARFLASEAALLVVGRPGVRDAWLRHVAGMAAVATWIVLMCHLSLAAYLALAVYPALSVTMLRTFAEHRAEHDPARRSVIVEANPILAFVFLNNNLHYLHHQRPAVAWYRLPMIYRAERARLLAENGGYCFSGYGEIARRFALAAKEPVPHPLPPAARQRPS